ncbi:hypothetical protein CBL_06386 [Carabus blaptoides fortunei]
MADDSLEVEKDVLPFYPGSTPRGMRWFDLTVLTPFQKKQLNELKVDTIRENNQYLARHPEIRALISLFVQSVLRDKKLGTPIHVLAQRFFTRPKHKLEKEVRKYLKERGEPLKKEGDSAVNILPAQSESTETKSSYQGLYTYLSYIDIQSAQEWEHEWASYGTVDVPMPSTDSSMNYFDVPSYFNDTMVGSTTELDENDRKLSGNIHESTKNLATLFLTPNNSKETIGNVEELQAIDVSKSPEDLKSIFCLMFALDLTEKWKRYIKETVIWQEDSLRSSCIEPSSLSRTYIFTYIIDRK